MLKKSLGIRTTIHGRVLVRDVPDPVAVIVGFHGYMENAEIQMTRLEALPHSDRATLVAVQALNRFYRGRSEDVVASWMTRQDRESSIADNLEYCDRAIESTAPAGIAVFTLGFSQGAAMAFRAGIRGRRRAAGIIAVGGDVPPELLEDQTTAFPAVLLARGARDDWYTMAKLAADVGALRARATLVDTLVYPGGHEWTAKVGAAAGVFMRNCRTT